jgi:predicted carbohydrate-binding protein with CBM5 and CBM33 domain
MTLRRNLVLAATAAITACIGLPAVKAAPASAHGYVSSPASRQAQCAQLLLPCGEIRFEPANVQGPKGLRNCHADIFRFSDLSDDTKPWVAKAVGSTVSLTWQFTDRHPTASFEYFVGNTRLAVFPLNNQLQPPTLTHTINLGALHGRVRLLAVWNIGDTANAFYSCVDLQVA